MSRLRPLLGGGGYFEAPRWRDGRLWFVDCYGPTLLSIDEAGAFTTHRKLDDIPAGIGFLPNGDVLLTAMRRRRLLRFAGGTVAVHAELSGLAAGTIDDMVIDGAGRAYVGDLGFGLPPPEPMPKGAGRIILVPPEGKPRVVAEGLDFPNGMAIGADGRELIVAESEGDCLARYAIDADGGLRLLGRFGHFAEPDGICLDREGAVWVALFEEDAFVHVDRDGRELDRIAVPGRRGVACALGGAERRTLFCLTAETTHEDLRKGRSRAWIDAVEVSVPGAGWP